MGEPSIPQYIFTVRHGARLDAADSSWHLTSATPYDPPLTYGGWLQARSLGQRIGNILSTRSISPASSSPNPTESKSKGADVKRKQTRIVIHTSPFLRCIQTSIAISAGLSMHWAQQQQQECNTDNVMPKRDYIKPLLRVDTWLGEWLTPDYFTEVSPPPEMALLAATSKADLMRPSSAHAIRPAEPTAISQPPSSPLNNFAKDLTNGLQTTVPVGYTPPVQGYAISPNKPIPRGYVSHAKEYIDIDYPWDSTKFGMGGEYGEEWSSMHKRFRKGYKQMLHWFTTTDADITASKTVWGRPVCYRTSDAATTDGGKRFNGISSSERTADNANPQQQDQQEEEFETVVILVTHGAGCNALIGAMTDKPVLMDIGIASMTMAERTDKSSRGIASKVPLKTSYSTGIIPPPTHCPVESTELNITYDVKVMASTEHLRRGSMAALMNSTAGNSPKLVGRDSPSQGPLRSRPMSGSGGGSAFGGWSIVSGGTGGLGSPLLPLNESGLEDTSRYPILPRRSSVASTVSSTGLWSRPVTAAGATAGDVSPSTSEGGLGRTNSGKVFIDRERVHRVREQKERSASVRLVPSTTSSDDGEQAAGSEESDSGKEEHGTWIERKRRWTMDQANRKSPMS